MARVNKKCSASAATTHEGAPASRISPGQELRRSVLACLLWEDNFYEDGTSHAERIKELVPRVEAAKVAELAVEARSSMKLRHIPLLLAREMARHSPHRNFVASTLEGIIQRADELSEFLALYWKDGKQPLAGQVKKGLARAFTRFDAYQLAKYNRDSMVTLKDVLFMVHPKPADDAQQELWNRLVAGTLEPPDTWEVSLSAGKDRKETWTRLLKDEKLGALALLRNLRNMMTAGVDGSLVISALATMKVERILPFRFVAAARYAPQWEEHLERAMFRCLEGMKGLPGKTVLLVDVSGSMDQQLSRKSDMLRMDAACGLAVLARELSDDVQIYSFSSHTKLVPGRRGFALRDAVVNSQPHGSTYLGSAVTTINKEVAYDRIIVITDEQSHDRVPDPCGKGYMINVASYKNGVGYGKWLHIDGWSEAVLRYIMEYEHFNAQKAGEKV